MDQVGGLIRIGRKAKNLHLEAFRCGGIRTGSEFSALLISFACICMYTRLMEIE